MTGARWIAAVLLALAVGAFLILPDLLRGAREAQIEPVRVEPPSAGERERQRARPEDAKSACCARAPGGAEPDHGAPAGRRARGDP